MTVYFTDERKAEIKSEICERIAGGETLRAICREEGKPSWSIVYRWIEADEEFASRIAQSRQLGYDAIAEEALEIANTPFEGVKYVNGPMGSTETREDAVQHRKLQVETRLKLLAKWAPKKYGERIDHTSSDGSMSQKPTTIELVSPGDKR